MLKNFLILSTIMLLVVSIAVAGLHKGREVQAPKKVTGDEAVELTVSSPIAPAVRSFTGPGDSIAFTMYDYGSNGSVKHNIINFGDGTLAVGRMMADDAATNTRGTWYVYYNGASWSTPTKVEAARQGWSSIAAFGDGVGNIEVTAAHSGVAVGIDAAKGAGSFTEVSTGGPETTWPQITASGGSTTTMHIVGGDGALYRTMHTRSTDGGLSWDVIDQSIVNTAIGWWAGGGGADSWDVAAQTVGLVTKVVAIDALEGSDLALVMSTDDGATWAEQIIYDVKADSGELPLGEEDIAPDGSCAVVLDGDGNAHVVWGNYLFVGDSQSAPTDAFLSTDAAIMYWSAATGVKEIAFPLADTSIAPPLNGRDGNFASMPDIGVNSTGQLFVIYENYVPDKDDSGYSYEHIYALASPDGGATWSAPKDITPGTGSDRAFASLADNVDDYLHIVYNDDDIGGSWLQGDHVQQANAVKYLMYPAADLLVTGVAEIPGEVPGVYSLAQNYPNPFNPTTNISYAIPAESFVTLKVFDILGQEVATLVNEFQNPGTYMVDFNAADFANGAYFYRLQAGNFTDVKKMVLMK
ncbi:MAG: T9SS type A sorting domain-containing protein [Bacteroidota bacterium]